MHRHIQSSNHNQIWERKTFFLINHRTWWFPSQVRLQLAYSSTKPTITAKPAKPANSAKPQCLRHSPWKIEREPEIQKPQTTFWKIPAQAMLETQQRLMFSRSIDFGLSFDRSNMAEFSQRCWWDDFRTLAIDMAPKGPSWSVDVASIWSCHR